MTLIKIDRNSIQQNHNEGSCTTHLFGVSETTFKTECTEKEFEELKKIKEIIISTWTESINDKIKITGHLLDIGFMPALPGKWQIDSTNNIETIHHLPIPKYSFKYENTLIECSECKNLIPRNEIEHDSYYIEDDDIDYEICPICKAHDSFDYEFESIDDALKPV